MALRKQLEDAKKRSADSGVEPDRNVLSKEQRHQRISLFLQDFDHQAKEHLQEMKKELASLLQMAEKAFRVELLALPPAMRKMKRKDLLDLKEEDAAAATAVATLEKSNCGIGNLHSPRLIRTNSKRVKVTTIVEYKEAKEDQGTQSKKTSQKIFKTKSLTSAITDKKGILCRSASVCSTPNMRRIERSASLREPPRSTPRFTSSSSKRFAQRGISTGNSERTQSSSLRSSSMPPERSLPFVNIPLSDGQTLCSSGEDIQNIDVQLLNNDTVQHIHTLVNQLTALCGKATVK
ncbi:borealin-2 [Protobothrops mucrosquamatus]|uniref:borealin-2 n=1 Tax=Protobothrops mucrosquamatus TaxID=103944 RepID=UPI000775A85F|nr:borealin-2 [Protobothrops mucrosquamatus]